MSLIMYVMYKRKCSMSCHAFEAWVSERKSVKNKCLDPFILNTYCIHCVVGTIHEQWAHTFHMRESIIMFAVHVHEKLLWWQFCAGKNGMKKLIEANQLPCQIPYTQWILENTKRTTEHTQSVCIWKWKKKKKMRTKKLATFLCGIQPNGKQCYNSFVVWCDRNSDDWNWLKCDVCLVVYFS